MDQAKTRKQLLILVLTLENKEPISCIVAKVLGGSLASIPSNALDKEIIIRSTSESERSTMSKAMDEADIVRRRDRPAYATDVTALFNW